MATAQQLIKAYIALRDKLREDEEAFKKHKAAINSKMDLIEKEVGKLLNAQKLKSTRTDSGTAYKDKKEYVGVEDWEDFLDFFCKSLVKDIGWAEGVADLIKEKADWTFFRKGVSKTTVLNYMKEHKNQPPPGLKYESVNTINFRR